MPLAAGTRLGPYEIAAPIGAGGMGEVYCARDPRLGRDVAIKVLPAHLSNDPQALARFEREAKAVAALSHPNILAIFDVGADHGASYLVTELLEGEPLRGCLGRGALPWRKTVEIGARLAEGLAAAHSKGIIHRDLKPENIFLTSDGRVKILDFGLARRKPVNSAQDETSAPTETDSGTIMGTVGYMSPEQVRGGPADAASDIFSLGCVLYEMIAGRRAFARQTAVQTMAAILETDPPPLADRGSEVPPDLQEIIRHCLEKKLEQRFQSARDLAFALRTVSDSRETRVPAGGEPRERKRLSRAIDSLAILPFVNVGGDANVDYLSDGITENLINSFSQLPKLRVVPRSRVFRYKGREADSEKVGRELNVRAVLTGRVVQRGEGLNIQTELVDVAADSQLWGKQYERRFSEIIVVQDEITREVSEKLRLRATAEEQRRLAKQSTRDPEAYQLYLKGLYHWNKRSEEGIKKSIEFYSQAIEKDPNYARGYAGLADSYRQMAHELICALHPRESVPKAKAAAMRALELDETLAEPHMTIGDLKLRWDWDWPGAEKEYRRAIELNPGYATAHQNYSHYLLPAGRTAESLAESIRALELEPLSLIINIHLAWHYLYTRENDKAIEQSQKTLELDQNFALGHFFLGQAYEGEQMHQEAINEFQKGVSLSRGGPVHVAGLGHAYAVSGRKDEAAGLLQELKEQAKRRYVPSYEIAVIHVGLGEEEAALGWLEQACDACDSSWLIDVNVDPRFDCLHSSARFQALLRRMKLDQCLPAG